MELAKSFLAKGSAMDLGLLRYNARLTVAHNTAIVV